MGYDKIIVVLTRPAEYRKESLSSFMSKAMKVKYKKYPKFVEAMAKRHEDYNASVAKIGEMEAAGEVFVIRPFAPIKLKTIERDPEKLQEVYDLGIKDASAMINELNNYLKVPR